MTMRCWAQFETIEPSGLRVARVKSDERPGYRIKITQDGFGHVIYDPYTLGSALADYDIAAITHSNDTVFYYIFGAHPITHAKLPGIRFVVWAPNAHNVSVVGQFNDWDGRRHPMRCHSEVGVWEIFIPHLTNGTHYKFEIKGHGGEQVPLKADPVAFAAEHPPATASVAHGLPRHAWADAEWLVERARGDDRKKPISIYEVHLGSWARIPEEDNRRLTYRELADRLIPYVKDMGFTHIEMLPITEFPYDGSWGYQPVSLFAPTSRFGTPEDFAYFVDAAHAAGIALILDWVPAHFPNDAHGLASFDATHLYEHADPRQGFHQDWGTYIYNFGRKEVQAYLIANARFWLDQYHLDGLRVDAVASMLYLDYSRKANEWVPNQYGGNENLEAIGFLRKMNEVAYQAAPGVVTIAEESTAWPGVSQPTFNGGLGFGFKWNMGWMHDSLRYIGNDPVHRRHHHSDLTFGLLYAFSENFILPISHDEVVHGKGSLLDRMPGDEWQRFANLRAYLGFMFAHPGKKLLFMGCEFAQAKEWNYDTSLDWHLLDNPSHKGVQSLVRDLNRAYAGDARSLRARLRRIGLQMAGRRRHRELGVRLRPPRRGRGDGGGRLELHAGAAPQLPHRRPPPGPLQGGGQHRRRGLCRLERGQHGRGRQRGRALAWRDAIDRAHPAAAGDDDLHRGVSAHSCVSAARRRCSGARTPRARARPRAASSGGGRHRRARPDASHRACASSRRGNPPPRHDRRRHGPRPGGFHLHPGARRSTCFGARRTRHRSCGWRRFPARSRSRRCARYAP